MQDIQSWVDSHFARIKEDFFAFLRFKTVSADLSSRPEMERCAEWLAQKFRDLRCRSEVIATSGWPLVFAEDLSAGPNAPTLLIYGHYDVQPVDPLDLWKSDPFEPIEKDGEVFARGAEDDKGQVFYALTALQAMRETGRKLPVNLKFCIEGEEESGSAGLTKSLPGMKEKLAADHLAVIDFGLLAEDMPAINLGARGLIALEAVLRGSNIDLHSGGYGGVAYNPNRAAAEWIAKCWDKNGRVAIPHFYDDVANMPEKEKRSFYREDKKWMNEVGIHAIAVEKGVPWQDALWFRPTLEINGLCGGYTGKGFKTVIPAETVIKISCRLVPDQDPDKIGRLVKDFLMKNVKKGMQVSVEVLHGGRAYRSRPDSKLALAFAKAYEEIFGQPCQHILTGGSIPVVADLIDALKLDVVGIGYGLPSDNVHAPNEHFGLDRLKKGIHTVVRGIEILGEK